MENGGGNVVLHRDRTSNQPRLLGDALENARPVVFAAETEQEVQNMLGSSHLLLDEDDGAFLLGSGAQELDQESNNTSSNENKRGDRSHQVHTSTPRFQGEE